MIPKVIHYCWLSDEPKPKNVRQCIKSWKRLLPDFEIRCWDARSFDFDSVPFTRQAMECRKWAFVSDYIRLHALYTQGGIYLDSDVQVLQRFDRLLEYDLFTGIEKRGDTDRLFIEAAIIGACPGNATIGKCLDFYKTRTFGVRDGGMDMTPIPTLVTPIFIDDLGWQPRDTTQELANRTIVVDRTLIANSESALTDSMLMYHWNNRAWVNRNAKETAYKFVKDIGLLPVWNRIRTLLKK